jgi:quercetin dioxygenase-like cupin family protein
MTNLIGGDQDWLDENGELIIATWANVNEDGSISPLLGEGPVHMHNTEATAWDLVSSHGLGVDHISVPAGAGFPPHTHPGHHLLIIISGRGTMTVNNKVYPTKAGQVYFVPGEHPHAVGAIDEHHILAVGYRHKKPSDPERMKLVDYASIASELGTVECGLCGVTGQLEQLSELGCVHAPTRMK